MKPEILTEDKQEPIILPLASIEYLYFFKLAAPPTFLPYPYTNRPICILITVIDEARKSSFLFESTEVFGTELTAINSTEEAPKNQRIDSEIRNERGPRVKCGWCDSYLMCRY